MSASGKRKGLLVRVAIDSSSGGWNGPVDSVTGEFAYVPIDESRPTKAGMACPYTIVLPALVPFSSALPRHLLALNMHLDPDFLSLTYGDQGQRARRILSLLGPDDLIAFYGGLRDIHDLSIGIELPVINGIPD